MPSRFSCGTEEGKRGVPRRGKFGLPCLWLHFSCYPGATPTEKTLTAIHCKGLISLVGHRWLEHRTNWLRVSCSTNWANDPRTFRPRSLREKGCTENKGLCQRILSTFRIFFLNRKKKSVFSLSKKKNPSTHGPHSSPYSRPAVGGEPFITQWSSYESHALKMPHTPPIVIQFDIKCVKQYTSIWQNVTGNTNINKYQADIGFKKMKYSLIK